MTKHQPPLYVRRNRKISGPFPVGQIAQALLLGRYKLSDEVSADKDNWSAIGDHPDLIPEVLKADPGDDMAQERLKAARRWADERRPATHGEAEGEHVQRRAPETYETLEYRVNREAILQQQTATREFSLLQLLAVIGFVVALLVLGFIYAPQTSISEPDCAAPPAPGVNWRNCRLAGISAIRGDLSDALLGNASLGGANFFGANLSRADLRYTDLSLANLSYADFSHANLKGAGLQNTDLSEAVLQQADLSYANLIGANLSGANLDGAIFDHAIWIDGSTCMGGSIGVCRTVTR